MDSLYDRLSCMRIASLTHSTCIITLSNKKTQHAEHITVNTSASVMETVHTYCPLNTARV